MIRAASGLLTAFIGLSLLTTGCAGSDEEYCAKVPGYLKAMGESMQGDLEDPQRLDGWATAAKETAAVAPEELKEHWDFLVDYAERMSAAAGDGDVTKALKPDDVKKNGTAGNAVMKDAGERCDLGS